ncbi:MAG: hypothetical protein Q8K40_05210, partial [Ignavibacteria bacterium]|nr:hypothetical protein [Ignavibacteria bacterium]
TYSIIDSIAIDFKSIKVFVDSIETQRFTFDEKQQSVTIQLPRDIDGEKSIRIIAANKNGNFCFPFSDVINDKLPR